MERQNNTSAEHPKLTEAERHRAACKELLKLGGLPIKDAKGNELIRIRGDFTAIVGKICHQFRENFPSEQPPINNRTKALPDGEYLFSQNGKPGLDVFGGDRAEEIELEFRKSQLDQLISAEHFAVESEIHEGIKKHPKTMP